MLDDSNTQKLPGVPESPPQCAPVICGKPCFFGGKSYCHGRAKKSIQLVSCYVDKQEYSKFNFEEGKEEAKHNEKKSKKRGKEKAKHNVKEIKKGPEKKGREEAKNRGVARIFQRGDHTVSK